VAEVGSAFVTIAPSAKGFGSKLESDVGRETSSVGSKMGRTFGTLFKVGAVAAVGGALLLGKLLKGSIAEAREAQVVTARTENVIKKMGGAANVTAGQVAKLAESISLKTGIDDEAIQSGQNLLLTFGKISNQAGKGNAIFDRTSQLMVDMSTAMGTSAKSSAIQLGKALNDPIKGVSALTRVGVSFTEQQKEQIAAMVESGNTLGAQKLILSEVEKQFGGAAEAMATPADKARVAWDNLKEQLGTALLPVIDAVLNAFVKLTPQISTLIAGIGPAFSQLQGFLAPFVAQIQGLFSGGGGGGLLAGIQSFAATVQANFLPVLQTMATTFQTVVLPALTSFVQYLAAQLLPIFQRVGEIIATHIVPILASLAQFVYGTLYPAIVSIVRAVGEQLQPVFEAIVDVIQANVLPVIELLLEKFREAQPTIEKVIAVVVKIIGKVLEFAAAILGKVLPPLIRFVGFLLENVIRAIIKVIEFIVKIIGKVIDFGKAVKDRIEDVAQFIAKLLDFAKKITDKVMPVLKTIADFLVSNVKKAIQAVIDVVSGLIDKLQSAIDKFKELLGMDTGGWQKAGPDPDGPITAPSSPSTSRPSLESVGSSGSPVTLAQVVAELRAQTAVIAAGPGQIARGLNGVASDAYMRAGAR
jgi:phage-related protein